jgi:hypothetical protein
LLLISLLKLFFAWDVGWGAAAGTFLLPTVLFLHHREQGRIRLQALGRVRACT